MEVVGFFPLLLTHHAAMQTIVNAALPRHTGESGVQGWLLRCPPALDCRTCTHTHQNDTAAGLGHP